VPTLKEQMQIDMASAFFNSNDFAVPAVFNGGGTVNVIITEDAELRPGNLDVGLVEVGITLDCLVSDVGEPDHGSTFETDDKTYRVARIESNDGVVITLAVNEVT